MFLRITPLMLLGLASSFLASADEVSFSLSTAGSFSAETPSDLSFVGIGGFTHTTVAGTLALTDLGAFTLKKPSHAAEHYADTFTLDLIFSVPDGIDGQTPFHAAFDAALSGTVNTQHGSVLIDFGPAKTFAFRNATGSGVFDLSIDDLTLTLPRGDTDTVSQVLTGAITGATDPPVDSTSVPEPLSAALVVTVAVLVVGRIRRQTRAN